VEGIIIEIADHPITGDKRKVEITGLGINFPNEVIGLETICRYYKNVGGTYGDLVTIPQPIVIQKTLTATTSGERVVFVKADTGDAVIQKSRNILDGNGEVIGQEEYWVLKSDEIVEVPAENVTKLFWFLINILKTQSIVLEQIMIQFVVAEVPLGTYDQK
jgi:hypothetical protein